MAAWALAAVAGPPARAGQTAPPCPVAAASAAATAAARSAPAVDSRAAIAAAGGSADGACPHGDAGPDATVLNGGGTDPWLIARVLVARQVHAGRPFAVVDKRQAQLLVFDGQGALAGRSPALLGRTRGDRSVPGVGARTQQGRLTDADRTTPAGHFISEPGRNRDGEAVVWVDYDAAFAIHRLRPGPDHARRSRSLAGADPAARRQSAGCVVVPGAFFDAVVQPLLGRQRALVVVLPEDAPAPAAPPAAPLGAMDA